MMQVVSQELSAEMATMTIIHSEEGALRPLLMLPMLWLDDIQNNGYSVLVVPSDKTLISISSICPHNPVST